MKSKRLKFCGIIQGSIIMRKGETEAEALERAEDRLMILLSNGAASLHEDGTGPNILLEINDNQ